MEVAGSTPLHSQTRSAAPSHNPFSTQALQQQQASAALPTSLGNQPQHLANNHPPASNFHFYQQHAQQQHQQHANHNPYGHSSHSHSHSRGR